MPATESYCQSTNIPEAYRLHDGRTVELRWGCLVDAVTRYTVAGSDDAYDFLMVNAVLTSDDLQRLLDRKAVFELSPTREVINERKRQWKEGGQS